MLRKYDIPPEAIRMVNTVHDSLGYRVKNGYLEWFKAAFKIIAERPIPELNNTKFLVDCGTGRNWGEAELNSK